MLRSSRARANCRKEKITGKLHGGGFGSFEEWKNREAGDVRGGAKVGGVSETRARAGGGGGKAGQ